MAQDKQSDDLGSEDTSGGPSRHSVADGSRAGLKPIPKFKPLIEISCNNQASGILSLHG